MEWIKHTCTVTLRLQFVLSFFFFCLLYFKIKPFFIPHMSLFFECYAERQSTWLIWRRTEHFFPLALNATITVLPAILGSQPLRQRRNLEKRKNPIVKNDQDHGDGFDLFSSHFPFFNFHSISWPLSTSLQLIFSSQNRRLISPVSNAFSWGSSGVHPLSSINQAYVIIKNENRLALLSVQTAD